jgi:hypothetical protein
MSSKRREKQKTRDIKNLIELIGLTANIASLLILDTL